VALHLALYALENDRDPLATEDQRIRLAPDGTYQVWFGATFSSGLPTALFTESNVRWIGITIDQEPELPRTQIISVAYAARAASAEMLGTKTEADFVLSENLRQALQKLGFAPSTAPRTGGGGGVETFSLSTGETTTPNSIAKYLDNTGTLGEAAMLESGGAVSIPGNLGIGITSPEGRLHIDKDTTTITQENDYALKIEDGTNDTGLLLGVNATGNYSAIQSFDPGTSWTGRPLVLQPNGDNVGIGTINPQAKAHVKGAGLTAFTGSTDGILSIDYSDAVNDRYAALDFRATNQTADNPAARIAMQAQGGGSYLSFGTSNYYASGITNTALTINPTGNVGIGTTTPSATLHLDSPNSVSSNELYVGAMGNFGRGKLTFVSDPARATNANDYFGIGVNGYSNALVVKQGGNVGIGTTSPGSVLDVNGILTARTRLSMSGLNLLFWGSAAGGTNRILDGAPNIESQDIDGLEVGTGNSGPLVLYTNQSERVRISPTGNVGIGTSSPNISGAARALTVSTTGTEAYLELNGVRTTDATFAAVTGMNSGTEVGSLYMVRDGANDAGALALRTRPAGGIVTTRMRISSEGNVGIGTSSPTERLHVAGNALIAGANATLRIQDTATSASGEIFADGNGLNFRNLTGGGNFYFPTGNIGLGTTNTNLANGAKGVVINATGGGTLRLMDTGSGGTAAELFYTDTRGLVLQTQNSRKVSLRPGDIDALVALPNGNVGIGTTTPQRPLHVIGSTPLRLDRPDSGSFESVLTGAMSGSALDLTWDAGQANGGHVFYGRNSSNTQVFGLGVDRNGNVGIGTTSPKGKLHVSNGSSGVIPQPGFDHLVIEDDTTAALNLLTPDANLSEIIFGTPADVFGAMLRWDYSNNLMTLSPANANAALDLGYGNGSSGIRITSAGNVGVGTASPTAKLHVVGDVIVQGNIGAKYQDVAEWVDAVEPLPPATVVAAHPALANHVQRSTKAYDTTVLGVVSNQPGILLGEKSGDKVAVAQSGRVKVRIDARYGAIKPGDLIVASPTPGVAMLSRPTRSGMHRPGTIIGKALEAWPSGAGEILVLLTLQ
jgi:hypothetical protein